MEPHELTLWRAEHKFTKTALAKALHKTRQTVGNWESGATRLPKGFADTLASIDTSKPASTPQLPEWLTPATAKFRPDLALYKRMAGLAGQWVRDHEHPCALLADVPSPCPFAVLASEPYAQALARHRRGPGKRTRGLLSEDIEATLPHKVED